MTVLSKVIYRFNAIPYPNPFFFFLRNENADPRIHVELPRILHIQNNPEKEQSWRTYTSQFLNVLQRYSNQVLVGWHKHRYINTWNKTQSPEINSYIYGHLTFLQGCQDPSMREESVLREMVLGHPDIYLQKNEVGPLSHTIYKS